MTNIFSARRLGSKLMTLLLRLLLAGCASNQPAPVDWDSRVGNYTFEQAKTELGAPDETKTMPGGGTAVEWLIRRNAGGPATEPLRAGGVDQPNGVAVTAFPKNEYLVLSFDASGKLVKWRRLTR